MDSINDNSYLLALDGKAMRATVSASIDCYAVAPSLAIKYLKSCSERISGVCPIPAGPSLPGLEVPRCTVHISISKGKVDITINDWRTNDLLFTYEGEA